jgi:hypothetical protein
LTPVRDYRILYDRETRDFAVEFKGAPVGWRATESRGAAAGRGAALRRRAARNRNERLRRYRCFKQ